MDGSVLPLVPITNSTADPASRNLKVHVFGDGHLSFSLITPEGETLKLDWNAETHSGKVGQRGINNYTITAWIANAGADSQSG